MKASENASSLSLNVMHSKHLVIDPSEFQSFKTSREGSFGMHIRTYANTPDLKDKLTIELAYALKITTDNFDLETGEFIETEIRTDRQIIGPNDFLIRIPETDVGLYQRSEGTIMEEITTVQNGTSSFNETKKYTIVSSSSGTKVEVDSYNVKSENYNLFEENGYTFQKIGYLTIEASDFIKEFLVQRFAYQYTENLVDLVNGECFIISDVKKCVKNIGVIFRLSIQWNYSFMNIERTHQSFRVEDFGEDPIVDQYIHYAGYTGSVSEFSTPVIPGWIRSQIDITFGTNQFHLK